MSLRVAAGTVSGDGAGPGDLAAFVIALLPESREQDDPLVGSEPEVIRRAVVPRVKRNSKSPSPSAREYGMRAVKPSTASRSTTTIVLSLSSALRVSIHSSTSLWSSISNTGPIIADMRSSHKSDQRCSPRVDLGRPRPPLRLLRQQQTRWGGRTRVAYSPERICQPKPRVRGALPVAKGLPPCEHMSVSFEKVPELCQCMAVVAGVLNCGERVGVVTVR